MERVLTSRGLENAPEDKGFLGTLRGWIVSGRKVIAPVILYVTLSLAACGGGENNHGHTDGGGGDAGIADTDGGDPDGDSGDADGDSGDADAETDGGGNDGGKNPCPPYTSEDFQAAVIAKKGEGVTLTINDPDFVFNGATLTVPPVKEDTMIAMSPAIGVNVRLPDGITFVPGRTKGLELLALDPNDTVDPETCAPKEKAESPCEDGGCKLVLPGKSATVLFFDKDAGKWVEPGANHSSMLTKEGAVVSTEAVILHFSPFYFPNEKPEIDAAITALADGHVEVDLAGTQANNTPESYAFSAFIFYDGDTEIVMERVGDTGLVFRSVNPLSAGKHILTVEVRGMNFDQLPEEDKAEKAVEVTVEQVDPCKGNTCDDGDPCNGPETCDPENGQCVDGEGLDCDNGVFCDGEEKCVKNVGCPAESSGNPCQAPLVCDENADACVGCVKDEDCAGGYACEESACEDVNECEAAPAPCGEGYDCTNTPGSYECADVNECEAIPGPCAEGYECVNTPGSHECDNIDECAASPGPCAEGETCTDTEGSYECADITAPPAPVLSNPSDVKIDIDEDTVTKHVSFSADTKELRVYFTPAGKGVKTLNQTANVGGGITEMDLHIDVSPNGGDYDADGTYQIAAVDAANNESADGPNDSFDVEYRKPDISGLEIDCSSTSDLCGSGGFVYPVSFTATNATSCTATAQVISGGGTPGSTSAVVLNGNSGSFDYTTGNGPDDVIRLTVTCSGPGGNDSSFTDITLW